MADDYETLEPLEPEKPVKPRRRVWQNISYSLLLKAQGAVFTYILLRILLGTLTVEEYGLYSLLFIGVLINLTKLGQFGIPNLLMRFVPEYFTASKYKLISVLFVSTRRVQFIAAIVIGGLTIFFAPQIAGWINYPGSEATIRIFTIGGLSYLLSEQYHILFSGIFEQRTVFWNALIYNSARLAVIAFAAWRYKNTDYDLIAIVVAESAMLALSWLLYYIAYRRKVIPRVEADKFETETPSWPRYKKFATLCYINEIGVSLLSVATDLFLVSAMIGGAAVGYYGLANRINDLVSRALPNRLLGPVLQPLFYSEYGSAQKEAAFGFNLLTKMTFFVTLPVGIWLAIMSEPVIIHLFDPDYAPAAALVAVTALFLPMVTIRLPLGMMLLNAERIDLVIYSKVWAIAKIVVGIWLIPVYGVVGMVWITALSSFAQNVMIYYFIVTRMHVETEFSGMFKMLLNGGLSAALFWPIKGYLTGLIGVLASLILFGLIFLAVSVVVKAFTPQERAFINKHLRVPVWKF